MSDDNNVLPFQHTVDLGDLIEDTIGKKFVFGYVDEQGDLCYLVGDEMPSDKLLVLLESIKATHFYGLGDE